MIRQVLEVAGVNRNTFSYPGHVDQLLVALKENPGLMHAKQASFYHWATSQQGEPMASCMLSKHPSTTGLHPSPHLDAKMILYRKLWKDCVHAEDL